MEPEQCPQSPDQLFEDDDGSQDSHGNFCKKGTIIEGTEALSETPRPGTYLLLT